MTITLTHTFVSTIPDGVDTTVVRPSDWNASHAVSGTVPVANGGTDASTAAAARVNLLPSYTGNASKRLTINAGATDVEWVADGGGTVTSVAFSTGTTGLTVSGSPITSSGTFTLNGTLAVANGGTGATTAATARSNLGAAASGANTDITSLTNVMLRAPTFITSATVTAGSDAQGQGALTSDLNVITTAASSPSGVTLPTATTGRRIVVVNRGANTINIYPASGGTIDALSANAAIAVPATGWMEFIAASTTQWYSTANMATTALWS